jgi:hypothetical protein
VTSTAAGSIGRRAASVATTSSTSGSAARPSNSSRSSSSSRSTASPGTPSASPWSNRNAVVARSRRTYVERRCAGKRAPRARRASSHLPRRGCARSARPLDAARPASIRACCCARACRAARRLRRSRS